MIESDCTVLVKKIDGLRVRFHGVAAPELRWDLLDPLTCSILSAHLLFRSRRECVFMQSVYLFEKDCTYCQKSLPVATYFVPSFVGVDTMCVLKDQ
ncbi:hypothetical protein Y032_0001g2 [Ancylostoma ceylanicum]|uniref:Uncharacterized protein n=1 Tax=Ancylostoma ceylanicum TaxID=53326 RepID=A0A016W4U2_9BILA|nr:hypothetical protein Y032_0001g2 [Ancylostoma ceylanicum]